jgi:hypothetical protein
MALSIVQSLPEKLFDEDTLPKVSIATSSLTNNIDP